MPDIRTSEGRKAMRQAMESYAFMGDYIAALDGLDIAEERDGALTEWAAELWPHHKMEEGHRNDLCMCCRFWEIARPWQDWKQGMTPAEEER